MPVGPLVLLASCRDPSAPDSPSARLDAVQTWSPLAPMVAVVTWTPPAGTESWVELGLDGKLDRRTPSWSSGSEVVIPLLGLKAGRSYSWRAVSDQRSSDVGTFEVPNPPPGLPSLAIDHQDDGAQVPTGYLLASTTSDVIGADADTFVVLWDGDGDPVWWEHALPGHAIISPSFGATPGTVIYDDYDMTDTWYRAVGHRVRLDGTERVEVPLVDGTHVMVEPEPGVFAWGARDLRDGPADSQVTADRVLEAPLDGIDAPTTVVDLYDDLFAGEYTPPCKHPLLALTVAEQYPVFEWSHLNSLVYLPERDAYLVNLRWVDTVLLVDRPSGAVLWRLGGPFGEFTTDGTAPFWDGVDLAGLSHAHLSQAWDGGLVAFDNGTHRDPPVSGIVELAIDEGQHVASTVFRWDDPQGRYVWALGDVRKLPSGSYLASWSTLGELNEVDPDGHERWRAHTDPDRAVGRIAWTADLYLQ